MFRLVSSLLSLAFVSCSPAEPTSISVEIVAVSALEVDREGGGTVVTWQSRGSEQVYYSLTVGLDRHIVASGRAAGGLPHEIALDAADLDPCTNELVLTAVAPGGAAADDGEMVFLCPTPGCRGCTAVAPDGDADVDVDVDADGDADADTGCVPGSFPNGGSCDPVSSACCAAGETCEPDPWQGFVETCQSETGSGQLGSYCDSGSLCEPGLTCFSYTCTRYCGEESWDYDCPSAYRCMTFRVSVNFGPYMTCPSYGICLP